VEAGTDTRRRQATEDDEDPCNTCVIFTSLLLTSCRAPAAAIGYLCFIFQTIYISQQEKVTKSDSRYILQERRHTINNPTTYPHQSPHTCQLSIILDSCPTAVIIKARHQSTLTHTIPQLLSSKPTINHDLSSIINPSRHYNHSCYHQRLQSIISPPTAHLSTSNHATAVVVTHAYLSSKATDPD